jgi:DNA-binding winged helix-turn-helix (wHTH) protein
METRSSSRERRHSAEVVVSGPDGTPAPAIELTGDRVTIGRLPEANDVALEPDPQLLVGRVGHCVLEREGERWFVVDGGSVNGTFLRRGGSLDAVSSRTALRDGDVVCVLALVTDAEERRFFELAFHSGRDPQATRAAPVLAAPPRADLEACLAYDMDEARLVLVRGDEQHEIRIRPQAHRLVRHMADRNGAAGGEAPVLCTHDELMEAVWLGEPLHSRGELAKLVWELRRALQPLHAAHLLESEPRRGYRLRTCRVDAAEPSP